MIAAFSSRSGQLTGSLRCAGFILVPSAAMFRHLGRHIGGMFVQEFFPSRELSPSTFCSITLHGVHRRSFSNMIFRNKPSDNVATFSSSFPNGV